MKYNPIVKFYVMCMPYNNACSNATKKRQPFQTDRKNDTHVAIVQEIHRGGLQGLFACSFCVKLCLESHCANSGSGSIAPASVVGE